MDQLDKHIFQQLISDIQFIRWVKNEKVKDEDFWINWKDKNPKNQKTFDEAVRTVKYFSFRSPQISNTEINYLWERASIRMKKRSGYVVAKRALTFAAKVAAVFFIPLVLYTVWISLDKANLEFKFSQLAGNKTDQEITVVAPTGVRSVIDLPDGSKVWLNSGSQLTYPAIFVEKERNVRIEGEAYFEIAKSDIPLIVENAGPPVKVYGTAFNVNSYSNESMVVVALEKGKISLLVNGGEQFMVPGQVSYFDKVQKAITIKKEGVDQFICWKDDKFIFRDKPLSEILRIMQRRYNVDVELSEEELGRYKYNATFRDEGLERILELLELSAPIKCQYMKRKIDGNGKFIQGKVIVSRDKNRIVKH